jgi:hypothetical protein
MFGTFVICLPSEHAGGKVQLLHNGKQQALGTASTSAHTMSTLAWYSDVQREIKPVTSGYRLLLTYNLVQDQTLPKQSAAALGETGAILERQLRMWNNKLNLLDCLVYPLNHQYTPTSLSLQHLKGQDAAKCRYMEALCAQNGFYWFMARMTKTTSVESEDYGNDDEDNFTIGRTVIPSGSEIRLGLYSFDKENILADVDYDNRDPDSENEGEWTGNASIPSEFRYHDTVTIICRKESLI